MLNCSFKNYNRLYSNPNVPDEYIFTRKLCMCIIITGSLFLSDQKLCLIALVSKAFLSDEETDDEETNQVS